MANPKTQDALAPDVSIEQRVANLEKAVVALQAREPLPASAQFVPAVGSAPKAPTRDYIALTHLLHDGAHYLPGSTVALTDAEAAPQLRSKAVRAA